MSLEPFAEVERALLVVEVLELPRPQLGGHLGVGDGGEHCLQQTQLQNSGIKVFHRPFAASEYTQMSQVAALNTDLLVKMHRSGPSL